MELYFREVMIVGETPYIFAVSWKRCYPQIHFRHSMERLLAQSSLPRCIRLKNFSGLWRLDVMGWVLKEVLCYGGLLQEPSFLHSEITPQILYLEGSRIRLIAFMPLMQTPICTINIFLRKKMIERQFLYIFAVTWNVVIQRILSRRLIDIFQPRVAETWIVQYGFRNWMRLLHGLRSERSPLLRRNFQEALVLHTRILPNYCTWKGWEP
jgi:hypothetical protein